MANRVQIRQARSDDCEAILDVWRRAGSVPTVTDDLDSIRRVVAAEHARVLLAHTDDGSIVATIIAGWDGWRGAIYRLAVLPEHRRRGVARMLVEAAVAWQRSRGARRITLYTRGGEHHALAFWRSLRDLGFSEPDGDVRFVLNLAPDAQTSDER